MKKFINFIVLAFLLLFSACTSYKDVPYLQNSTSLESIVQYPTLFDARIMPKDLLTITVSCSQPELAVPFNLTVPTALTVQNSLLTSQPSLQSYLVDNHGNIDFPILGTMHVGSLTKGEVENLIKDKLKIYLNEIPIVNVRLVNYKISVLGEVAKPNTFTVMNEKVNVFEALSMAGDLTIYGKRDNVKLIRENKDGIQKIVQLDLNDANIVYSPYYYLQQNDILYITPNKTRARNSDISNSTTIWLSVTGTLVSIAGLLVTILK